MLNFLTRSETEDESEGSHFHIKSMKTSRSFGKPNRVLSFLRFASGLTLISAAVAMAFVAVKSPSPSLAGKSLDRQQAMLKLEQDRIQWLKNKMTAPGAEREGGPFAAAEQDYANRAFPAAYVPFKLTLNAHAAFKKVQTRSNANSNNGIWTLIGPSTTNFPDVLTFSGAPLQTPVVSRRWRSIRTVVIPLAGFGWQPQAAAFGALVMRFPPADQAGHSSQAVSRRMRLER